MRAALLADFRGVQQGAGAMTTASRPGAVDLGVRGLGAIGEAGLRAAGLLVATSGVQQEAATMVASAVWVPLSWRKGWVPL